MEEITIYKCSIRSNKRGFENNANITTVGTRERKERLATIEW